MKFFPFAFLALSFFIFNFPPTALAQDDIPLDLKRARGIEMLEAVHRDLKKEYYDPSFRGIDIEKSFRAARAAIKQAQRSGQINAIIAQFLLDLDDSHTYFLPADRAGFVEYGVSFRMVGERCIISFVKNGSDAEKKGVKVGDVVYAIETFEPTRDSLWKIRYFYNTLSPQSVLRLVFQGDDGKLTEKQIEARYVSWEQYEKELSERKKRPKRNVSECHKLDDISVCRLRTFLVEESVINKMMDAVAGSKSLVLDLRGNGGGYVKTLAHLVGYFFDREIKIGTEKMRTKQKDEVAVPRKKDGFAGELIVLVDSSSGSASEVFARVIQLEKRGVVIGDRSSGSVMTSISRTRELVNRTGFPIYNYIPYGASITIADLIMTDGKSLEKVGVIPDKMAIPTPADIRAKRDPVMALAVKELGGSISADEAGKLYTPDPDEAVEEEDVN
ncbi:MAG: hypothetical protein KF831_05350 [Acidobacteria bacterium]|nr:hypothetical protein [Acidobacteriota bacterium]